MTVRPFIQLILSGSLASGSLVSASADPSFEKDVAPFFEAHCVRCHGPDKEKGDLRIDRLSQDVGLHDTSLWAEVMEQISSGEMPPEKERKRPTAEAGAEVVAWLAERIEEGEATRMARRERVSFHRLSREEYVHTIYDLLGVYYDASDPGAFPEDPEWNGFERLGSILDLSPSQMEKYFMAAETVLAEAYPKTEPEWQEGIRHAIGGGNLTAKEKQRLEASPFDTFRYDCWPGASHTGLSALRPKVPGLYEFTVQLSGLKPADGPAPRLHVYEKILDRVLYDGAVVAPEYQPTQVTFRAHLPAGISRIVISNNTPGPSNLPRSGRSGKRRFLSLEDGRTPWQMKLTDQQGRPLHPFLIIDHMRHRGPLVSDEEKTLRASYLPSQHGNLDQLERSLARFAERAFRRPLRKGELDRYLALIETELAFGSEFQPAVETAMLAILCSKSFLFLVEGEPAENRNQLNGWETASRLSYMLWSTMPDKPLLDLAHSGKLSDPQVRLDQLRRMIADPRAKRFFHSFPRQWLHLRKVGQFPPDKKLYPDYDLVLEESMVEETTAFFEEVYRSKLSLREFIDSDWTMLNPRLARHYGLPEPAGNEFQRVSLEAEDHQRGGLFTQASLLSLTSDGTRHRPVHRGVHLHEVFYGKKPPPPPANVAAIEPSPVTAPRTTLRSKLAAHTTHDSCASCHRKIDPLGLAFENYDAIGRYRTVEFNLLGTGEQPPVDASGELPDGRSFDDVASFKTLLLEELDTFNDTLVKKLATYGLRRAMTLDDRQQLEQVARQSRQADYQLTSLLEAFVASELFLAR